MLFLVCFLRCMFLHTAARRRLGRSQARRLKPLGFQHTAARRRLVSVLVALIKARLFQHTAARRRLDKTPISGLKGLIGFNTQPPEGGWSYPAPFSFTHHCFNTQPPEGGWRLASINRGCWVMFQHTAARRRLVFLFLAVLMVFLFQHTAARRRLAVQFWRLT